MAHGRDREEEEEERHWIEPLSLRDAPKELRVFFSYRTYYSMYGVCVNISVMLTGPQKWHKCQAQGQDRKPQGQGHSHMLPQHC